MSVSLLRQTRVVQSLSAACRTASRCRQYSALATQPRHEPKDQELSPVAGPSQSTASSSSEQAQKGLEAQNADPDSLEPFSRVQSYLASINASGIQPTLVDLERCRPAYCPPHNSPKYAATYNELLNTLSRSFTKEQLRKFLVAALGTSRYCATNRKKVEYAESILEQLWKWPTLSAIEKAKRDRTEVINRTLPVSANELFLILGRDGSDLLRLSQDYNVHISLRQRPLALRVEGVRAAVADLSEHVGSLKMKIIDETFDLPSPIPIPEDMVQRISRLSLAYLENVEALPGRVRVCAKDAHALEAAKRLASRAIYEIEESSHAPFLTHLPAGTAAHAAEPLVMYPNVYALYPYLSPRPLPITMNTSGAFRLRRVGEFLSTVVREDYAHRGGLASGTGHLLTETELPVRLKEMIFSSLPGDVKPSGIDIRASLGHVLITRTSNQQRATLVPPLTGEHSFGKIRKWMSNNPVKTTFVPDLPLPLLNTSPERQKTIHRLVYHAISSSPEGSVPGEDSLSTSPTVPHPRKVISLEVSLADPTANISTEQDQSPVVERMLDDLQSPDEETSSASSTEPPTPILSAVRCWAGVQAVINVMMPDRPMDLQFTVCSSADLPESQQPAELHRYFELLHEFLQGSESQLEQPSPPLMVQYAGERYLLHTNTSVRQSEEMVADSGLSAWSSILQEVNHNEGTLTRALCESALDLEHNQRSMRCEVVCEDASSNDAWIRFLADCDRLSIMTYRSANIASILDGQETV